MTRRPTRSTRTDTLFPYTTLLPICRLETALEALESAGTAFDLDARLADGSRLLALHGRCAAPGAGATLWLEDRSEPARQQAALKAEVKQLRAALDGLPIALWLRDADGRLTD